MNYIYLALSIKDLWQGKPPNDLSIYKQEFQVFAAIANLLSNGARILLGLAGIGAILMIIWGGYLMITAGGDTAKISQGKQIILWAIIGIIFIALIRAFIWLIIRILSPLPINLPLSFDLIYICG